MDTSTRNNQENQAPEAPLLEGHDYDGIRELDNQLPSWWLTTFYLTILFALGYVFYYNIGDGPSIATEYRHAHELAEQTRGAQASHDDSEDTAALIAAVRDPARAKQGREIFQGKCVACHGASGQGVIGPNLTDDYWIHGGKVAEIAHTITHGVPEKGMPPWGTLLKPADIQSLVAYIRSIRGSNPPGAKAPQGVLVKDLDP